MIEWKSDINEVLHKLNIDIPRGLGEIRDGGVSQLGNCQAQSSAQARAMFEEIKRCAATQVAQNAEAFRQFASAYQFQGNGQAARGKDYSVGVRGVRLGDGTTLLTPFPIEDAEFVEI